MSHPEFRIEDSETHIPLIDEVEGEDEAPTKRNSIVIPPPLTGLSNPSHLQSSPNQNNNAMDHIAPLLKDPSRSGLIAPNSPGLPPCPGSPLHSLETSLWSPSSWLDYFLLQHSVFTRCSKSLGSKQWKHFKNWLIWLILPRNLLVFLFFLNQGSRALSRRAWVWGFWGQQAHTDWCFLLYFTRHELFSCCLGGRGWCLWVCNVCLLCKYSCS